MGKTYRIGIDIGTTSAAIAATCIDENGQTTYYTPVVEHIQWNKVSAKDNEKSLSSFERGESMAGKTPASIRRVHRSARKSRKRKKSKINKLKNALIKNLEYDGSYISIGTRMIDAKVDALSQKIDITTLCHIILDYTRYNGYSELSDVEETEESSESTEYMKRMNEICEWCQSCEKTISQFFVDHNNTPHRLDKELESGGFPIDQSLYREEFSKIWKEQSKYDVRLTSELYSELTDIIYYRRPLKTQKYLKSKCSLETGKRVCNRSDPFFESFRVWAKLRNLRVTYDRILLTIPQNCLNDIYEIAKKQEVTESALFSVLINHFPENKNKKLFSIKEDEIPFMKTYSSIRKVLGEITLDQSYIVWQTLHSESSINSRINALVKNGYTKEQSERLSKIRLDKGTSNYSHKAVKNLIPLMDGTKNSLDEHYARESIYPSKTKTLNKELVTIKNGELRNPLVQSVSNEAIRLLKNYKKSLGVEEDDKVEIVLEMTRSLSKTAKQRKSDTKNNKKRRAINDRALKVLESIGYPNTENNKRRLLLWEEQGGCVDSNYNETKQAVCIYSGYQISLRAAFDRTVTEIEHTIPQSRVPINALYNVTLSICGENKQKDNLTASEYISLKTKQQQDDCFERIERLYRGNYNDRKYSFFFKEGKDLDSMIGENHLSITGHIASSLKEKLVGTFSDVIVSNGSVTSLIRSNIGVTSAFKDLIYEQRGEYPEDKRSDLRHHGMDAMICSIVKQEYIRRLSSANADPHNKMEGAISYIKRETKDQLHHIMEAIKKTIVIRPKERDPLFKRRKKKEEKNRSIGIRGSLHDQNPVKKYEPVFQLVDSKGNLRTIEEANKRKENKIQNLIKRQKELAKEGRDLHAEFGRFFKSERLEAINKEFYKDGKTLEEFFNDKRVIDTPNFLMIDPNITEASYKVRDGHFLSNSTNYRAFYMKSGKTIVEPLHQYVDKKMNGKTRISPNSPEVQMTFYSKSLVLLGYDEKDFDKMISEGNMEFLQIKKPQGTGLYWVSGIEGEGGRIKLYPHNMTSSDKNKSFAVRKSPSSLVKDYQKILILDNKDLIQSLVGHSSKETAEV